MSTPEWNTAWGSPEDYNIVEGQTEYRGFTVGDKVEAREDGSDEEGFFEGDSGVVIGVSFTPKGGWYTHDRTELVVEFDGMDPTSVNPDYLNKM